MTYLAKLDYLSPGNRGYTRGGDEINISMTGATTIGFSREVLRVDDFRRFFSTTAVSFFFDSSSHVRFSLYFSFEIKRDFLNH